MATHYAQPQQHNTSPWTEAFDASAMASQAADTAGTQPTEQPGQSAPKAGSQHQEQQPTHDALADIYNRH